MKLSFIYICVQFINYTYTITTSFFYCLFLFLFQKFVIKGIYVYGKPFIERKALNPKK